MFWDDLIRRWRRDARLNSPNLLRAAGGHVAVLPAPRPRRRRRVLMLLLALVAIGALLLIGPGRVRSQSGEMLLAPHLLASSVPMTTDLLVLG
jgi:hypothetical protein